MSYIRHTFALSAVALLGTGSALAEEYIFSTWLNQTYVFTAEGNIRWADSVREASNGRIDFEVMTDGVLLPATGVIEGISGGVAQAGPVAPTYYPSRFPVANALSDFGFANPDPMLLTFAYSDFMMHESQGIGEWHKNDLVFGAGGATPIYYPLCTEDLKTLADLQGKRLRVPGGGFSRLTDALGAIPVNIPGSEIYIGMDRGVLDCAIGDATQLTSGTNILELVDSIIMLPMNPSYITGMITYNPRFWQSLSAEDRRLLLDQSARAMARTQIVFTQEADDALDAARAAGVPLYEPEQALQQAYDDFVENGAGGMAEVAHTAYGIEDPDALFSLFQTYIDKWSALLKDVDRNDEEALTAMVKQHLFDTIDVSTYGMQ